ncbi:MAG: LPS assembly protein LptD, partial [Desulfobacteraceae bacterium]|nr:LPS assembly protein LptD [Desulfobacteraceae bacterium]
ILTTKSLVTPEKTISETQKKLPKKTDETTDPSLYDYREFVRLTISGYYDIREATTDDPTERIDPDERQPWSPMYVELNFAPSRYISLRGDLTYDFYDDSNDGLDSHNIAVNLSDNRGDRLFVQHRYRRDSQETIYTDLWLTINERWAAYAEYERNIYDDLDIRTSLGVVYQAQCWALDINYLEYEDTSQFGFMLSFSGLGEFRRRFSLQQVQSPVEYD